MSAIAVVRNAQDLLAEAGLHGAFLVRDLDTGAEIGFDADTPYPAASLVKVPLAVAVLERVARGELDPATPVDVAPGRIITPGPTGLSRFRHPARIAVDDLLYLSTCINDSVAADALFDLVPPTAVTTELRSWCLVGRRTVSVRSAAIRQCCGRSSRHPKHVQMRLGRE
ncbi:Beta-lactamase [Micromonospora saelicesensis]|uniref:Beta-lactamase n=1 Tax=Micromonospora saelicesensis TaxID=285676 RepID=A0ABX9CHV0_9ACTN|nr:Beta-lactamase [Micromonospora saelicesensis]RAO50919.1 Beta-lactamase [Micromonospora saelicesensis]